MEMVARVWRGVEASLRMMLGHLRADFEGELSTRSDAFARSILAQTP
jgi:hypothetical protein